MKIFDENGSYAEGHTVYYDICAVLIENTIVLSSEGP